VCTRLDIYVFIITLFSTKYVNVPIYIYLYDVAFIWIKSFLEKTIESRAIYENLENKINTLYWPVENSIPKNNDRRQSHISIWKSRVTNVFPLNTRAIKLPPKYSV
jgi:hypothetical protein